MLIKGFSNRDLATLNRYRDMLQRSFFGQLDDLDNNEMWFHQHGATSHTAGVTIDLLKSKVDPRVICGNGPVDWSPSSCDLTPPDCFLWGYVKSLVYANKPGT